MTELKISSPNYLIGTFNCGVYHFLMENFLYYPTISYHYKNVSTWWKFWNQMVMIGRGNRGPISPKFPTLWPSRSNGVGVIVNKIWPIWQIFKEKNSCRKISYLINFIILFVSTGSILGLQLHFLACNTKRRKLALILHTKKAFFSICSYIRNLSSSFFSSQHTLSHSTILF